LEEAACRLEEAGLGRRGSVEAARVEPAAALLGQADSPTDPEYSPSAPVYSDDETLDLRTTSSEEEPLDGGHTESDENPSGDEYCSFVNAQVAEQQGRGQPEDCWSSPGRTLNYADVAASLPPFAMGVIGTGFWYAALRNPAQASSMRYFQRVEDHRRRLRRIGARRRRNQQALREARRVADRLERAQAELLRQCGPSIEGAPPLYVPRPPVVFSDSSSLDGVVVPPQ
jgi:hypothetical protein